MQLFLQVVRPRLVAFDLAPGIMGPPGHRKGGVWPLAYLLQWSNVMALHEQLPSGLRAAKDDVLGRLAG
jgi:hypothetical protein